MQASESARAAKRWSLTRIKFTEKMNGKNERADPQFICKFSTGLWELLQEQSRKTNEPVSHIVSKVLAEYFQVSHSTLYQVSTANALVEGIYVCRSSKRWAFASVRRIRPAPAHST
jgi:hypothetical protein